MKKKDVYNKAKATWGIDAQVTKAVEELSELIKELSKFLLDDGNMEHITEEMADVEIMIEQLKLIFENKKAVKIVKKEKIHRLSDRLDEEEKPADKSCNNCKNVEWHRHYISCAIGGFCHNHSGWISNAE
ncbi:hypothetical protein [Bacteroides sp.]|uniref:hypothetical protein n=1 Tax=Bacteroides sp. TaxID=29523 RepID=UPI002612D6F9|nr:hypothetical protein [Bacteroides sp.]MDD3041118.1 hypothetical protein [Bacteroides sp.]